MVHHQAVDDVVAQAVGIGGIMPEGGKPPRPRIVPVQSAAIRAEPQITGAILDDRDHECVGEVRRTGPRFPEKAVLSALAIDPRQSEGAAHPDVLLAVRIHAGDDRSQKALRIVGLMAVALERQRFSLKLVHSGRRRAHPDAPLAVLEYRHEHIAR